MLIPEQIRHNYFDVNDLEQLGYIIEDMNYENGWDTLRELIAEAMELKAS